MRKLKNCKDISLYIYTKIQKKRMNKKVPLIIY